MKTPSSAKPARITCEDLEAIARQGVERALAARQGVVELTPEQAQEVGGAIFLKPPIINGGFPAALNSALLTGGLATMALY